VASRSSRPTWSSAAVVRALVVCVALADVFAAVLVARALVQSRAHHRERAVVATQNVASGLEEYLEGILDKIDLALLAVRDEHAGQLASGRLDRRGFEAFIVQQAARVPELSGIRVADARGDIVFGEGADPASPANVADRPYFMLHRDAPGAGVLVSSPIVGRVTGKPQLAITRRLSTPGGRFAGVVIASLALDDVALTFMAFDVGPRGVITLRGADLGLIVSRGPEGTQIAPAGGTVSPELEELVRAGRTSAAFSAVGVGGVERTFTFRRLERYPLYVIAGLAFDDYFGEWRREAVGAIALVTLFAALTTAAAWGGLRASRRREAAVAALAEEENKFRLLAESATDLIWMLDPDLRLAYVSPAVERLLGYTVEEALALPGERLYTPESSARVVALRDEALRLQPRSQPYADTLLELELVRRDGRVLQAEATVKLRWSPEGRLLGALGITRDVTERRELQARMRLTERMASVGTLAAGIAHEVNNPLTYVLSNVGFALEQLQDTRSEWAHVAPLQEAEQALREALAGADRVRHIVRDLKTFSRPDGDRLVPLELNPIIVACLQMTANQTAARARVVRRLGVVPCVRATEARLGQVILNLLVNAGQAIPEGRPEANEIVVGTARAEDGRVELEVRDTGAGIPADVLPRIFDPFFTTKSVGEGTGLGLSICHGIVKSLGGDIQVESAVGQGTCFRVLLPAASAGAAEAGSAAPPARGDGPVRCRVLVVDDDALVARAVARSIGGGHAVEVATEAREVLARVAAGERWDLVLCDLMMPDLSGMELHARVLGLDPAQADRLVFMTGGAYTARAREFLDSVPNARLEKPIDRRALDEVLEAAVRRARALGRTGATAA